MSEILGSVLGGGLGSRLSGIADAIIDPLVAIITLTVFAILLPVIVNVLETVKQTSNAVQNIQSTLASGSTSSGATALQNPAPTNPFTYGPTVGSLYTAFATLLGQKQNQQSTSTPNTPTMNYQVAANNQSPQVYQRNLKI